MSLGLEKDVNELKVEILEIASTVQDRISRAIQALTGRDVALARKVCNMDDQVDALTREMFMEAQNDIIRTPIHVWQYVHLMSAAPHLERIADHATNIAEDVVYMVKGEIIRHRAEDYKDLRPKRG